MSWKKHKGKVSPERFKQLQQNHFDNSANLVQWRFTKGHTKSRKLTRKQVEEIRELYFRQGWTLQQLVDKFYLKHRGTASNIIRFKRWNAI